MIRLTTPKPRPFVAILAAVATSVVVAGAVLPPAAVADPINNPAPTSGPGTFTEQNIAADRTAENFFYRIPALTDLGGNVVLASWDGRPGGNADAPNPNSIMLRRSTDGGRTWGPTRVIAQGNTGTNKYGYSDPSFVYDRETGKVFAFFVYSKDQGLFGSQFGNNDADRQIISAAVIESADRGLTWSTPRLITQVAKPGADNIPDPGDVQGMFASSGEGIQLRYGAYQGRLIQQFAGTVYQAGGGTSFQAYSIYSDDHGATWKRGAFVGTGMDENKVVELSDGRVMLNSRDSHGSGFRKVAISTDGGHSYGPVTVDRQLIEPRNNGAIARMFPDAALGSHEAKKVMFVNTADQGSRRNVAIRVSCDNGVTWPGYRSIQPADGGYATARRMSDGRIGVLYEKAYVNDIRYAAFDDAWLNYTCQAVTAPDVTVNAGTTQNVTIRVVNQENFAMSNMRLTIATPAGWSAPSIAVPTLNPGQGANLVVPLTANSTTNGSVRMDALVTRADGKQARGSFQATAVGATSVGATVTGTAPTRDLASNPYRAGETFTYQLKVTNTSNANVLAYPTSSNLEQNFQPPASPNCRYLSFPVGASYTCNPSHVLTADDITRGWFQPTATFTITANDNSGATTQVSFTGAQVPLR